MTRKNFLLTVFGVAALAKIEDKDADEQLDLDEETAAWVTSYPGGIKDAIFKAYANKLDKEWLSLN